MRCSSSARGGRAAWCRCASGRRTAGGGESPSRRPASSGTRAASCLVSSATCQACPQAAAAVARWSQVLCCPHPLLLAPLRRHPALAALRAAAPRVQAVVHLAPRRVAAGADYAAWVAGLPGRQLLVAGDATEGAAGLGFRSAARVSARLALLSPGIFPLPHAARGAGGGGGDDSDTVVAAALEARAQAEQGRPAAATQAGTGASASAEAAPSASEVGRAAGRATRDHAPCAARGRAGAAAAVAGRPRVRRSVAPQRPPAAGRGGRAGAAVGRA